MRSSETRKGDVSQPVHEVQVEHHVKVPMRDGTQLDATVWRPVAAGRYPVLVERVAYELASRCSPWAEYFARRGYVFVGQNGRGTHASAGEFDWFWDDAWGANRDGYDTVEWAGAQPWSSGNVGMFGGSYSGFTQYLAAPTRPPHLKALFVRQGFSDMYSLFYREGTFRLTWLQGVMMLILDNVLRPDKTSPEMAQARVRLERALEEADWWKRHLPLKSCPPLEAVPQSSLYFGALDHPEDGPYWQPLSLATQYAEVDVPIFHLGGWFDLFLGDALRSFVGLRAHGRTAQCRRCQRMLIGPWVHGSEDLGRLVAELDFGPPASLDWTGLCLHWYDYWLKGIDTGIMDEPAVRLFLMGENRWLDLEAWPPDGVTYTPAYLREGTGRTDGSLNNGVLTFALPEADERPDSFVYDPFKPVPSLADYPGPGPRDHRALEGKMLTYTSAPLEQDLAVVGPVRAVLYGLSSAPDTDWVVRMCDVYPDGRSMSVCDGILRARYRDAHRQPELIVPGQIYRFEIDLLGTAQTFQAGHCLRLHVTSSDFPRYDRNLNTGGPFGEEVQGQAAVNTVFHDCMRPSHLLLPIYPPSSLQPPRNPCEGLTINLRKG